MRSQLLIAIRPLHSSAQTTPTKTADIRQPHTATTTAAQPPGCCVKLPSSRPRSPPFPPARPAPSALHHHHRPAITLDYASPDGQPALRQISALKPESFSLDYIDTKVGTGELAAPHKWYTVHYTGYLLDGTKFDSSVDRGEPITFPRRAPGHPGLGHRLCRACASAASAVCIVPYQLGYGANGHGTHPAKAELVFDVELISQSDNQPRRQAAAPAAGSQSARASTEPAAAPASPAEPPPTSGESDDAFELHATGAPSRRPTEELRDCGVFAPQPHPTDACLIDSDRSSPTSALLEDLAWGGVACCSITSLKVVIALDHRPRHRRHEARRHPAKIITTLFVSSASPQSPPSSSTSPARFIIGASREIEFDLRNDLFANLERQSASFYHTHRTGDIMARTTNDLNAVRQLLGPAIMYSANTVVFIAVALPFMIHISPG